MAISTRNALSQFSSQLDESMGVRTVETRPQLSPVPNSKDVGRRPLRTFGRVEIDRVMPDPGQPRTEFTEEAIQELSKSIKDKGQLHPIRVRWSDTHQKWLIISGERRWRASKAAELETVDCYFHDGELAESEILEQQLVENLLREDLKPMEEARAFSQLMELNGWNGKQVAEALRVNPSKVSRAISLLTLPADLQAKVDSGELAARSAYELSKLKDDDARREMAERATRGELTTAQAASVARQHRGKPKQKVRGTKQVFATENGIKVTVSASKIENYFEIEQSLVEALEEVRHRINNNVQMF